ncbi:hypothetical protein, partial [Halosimplex carlsbadense]|uniref:hypothetical protein n=1 Tax=Halosimplex carlsbadense TaxID=171164 RepID=UPI001955254C
SNPTYIITMSDEQDCPVCGGQHAGRVEHRITHDDGLVDDPILNQIEGCVEHVEREGNVWAVVYLHHLEDDVHRLTSRFSDYYAGHELRVERVDDRGYGDDGELRLGLTTGNEHPSVRVCLPPQVARQLTSLTGKWETIYEPGLFDRETAPEIAADVLDVERARLERTIDDQLDGMGGRQPWNPERAVANDSGVEHVADGRDVLRLRDDHADTYVAPAGDGDFGPWVRAKVPLRAADDPGRDDVDVDLVELENVAFHLCRRAATVDVLSWEGTPDGVVQAVFEERDASVESFEGIVGDAD